MNIKQLNEKLERLLEDEVTDELLSFSSHDELIHSEGDYDDYLCESPEKGYCVTSITYEYNEPQINYQTEWYPTKEDAIKAYKSELGIED